MWEPLVIDTNALYDTSFLSWLGGYRNKAILPPVAYLEYSIYQRRRGKKQHKIDHLIKKVARLNIGRFQEREAKRAIDLIVDTLDPQPNPTDFKKHWRDYMIASYAYIPPTIIATNNKKDFYFIDEKRVKTPQEIQKMYPHI